MKYPLFRSIGGMAGRNLVLALVAVSIVVLGFAVVLPQLQPSSEPSSSFSLLFNRTGGFAGVDDTLTVNAAGGVTFSSRYGTSLNATLNAFEFSHLKQEVRTYLYKIQPMIFHPRNGSADFFAYRLIVKSGDQTSQLSWVDEWASTEPIPSELRTLQQTLQGTIQVLTVRTTYANMNATHADLACPGNQGTELCGALTLTVYTDKHDYKVGDQVQIFVALSNTGVRGINYTSPTPCDPNFLITIAGDNLTQDLSFSESQPQACIQVLQQRSVDPNGTITQRATWNLAFSNDGLSIPARAGSYLITVRFPYANFEPTLLETTLRIVLE